MSALDWILVAVACFYAAFMVHAWRTYRPVKNPPLLDQELREQKAENALLVYERTELVNKLRDFEKRCGVLNHENRELRRRIVALEDLAAVHGMNAAVIKKCDEALERIRRETNKQNPL